MSSGRRAARLDRIVRVVGVMLRQEVAELVRRQVELRAAGEIAADAERQLDAPAIGEAFLSQLAIIRASRARKQLAEAHAQVQAQVDAALDAVGKKKAAEGERDALVLEWERERALRAADDVLERVGRSQKTSLR